MWTISDLIMISMCNGARKEYQALAALSCVASLNITEDHTDGILSLMDDLFTSKQSGSVTLSQDSSEQGGAWCLQQQHFVYSPEEAALSELQSVRLSMLLPALAATPAMSRSTWKSKSTFVKLAWKESRYKHEYQYDDFFSSYCCFETAPSKPPPCVTLLCL